MSRYRPLLTVLVALVLVAQVLAARTRVKPGMNFFSKQQEIQLGKEAAADLERQLSLVRDRSMNTYVSQLGRRLARYSPAPNYPYTFKVVRDKRINAFALPGGPIYVHTGTVAAAENEGQLAGVMGHEIAHVALRHGTNNASKAMLAQMPLAILGGVIGSGSLVGQLARFGIGFGANSVLLKFSRNAERQADIIGTQMLFDAGYDPQEMARFFQKLQGEKRGGSIEFLSSHPNPGNRVEGVRKEIRTLGPQKYQVAENPDFGRARSRAVQLNRQPVARRERDFGHEERGEHQHPRLPSRNFRVFDAGSYRIRYPDNWQVHGKQTSVQAIAPPEGIVRSRETSGIAYGALVSIFEPELDPERDEDGRISLYQASSQLIEQLQHSNPGMRVISRRQRTRVGRQRAISLTLRGPSPVRGENEMDWLVCTLQPDGTLWYIVFVAPEQDFGALRPTFEQMLDSVRFPR